MASASQYRVPTQHCEVSVPGGGPASSVVDDATLAEQPPTKSAQNAMTIRMEEHDDHS